MLSEYIWDHVKRLCCGLLNDLCRATLPHPSQCPAKHAVLLLTILSNVLRLKHRLKRCQRNCGTKVAAYVSLQRGKRDAIFALNRQYSILRRKDYDAIISSFRSMLLGCTLFVRPRSSHGLLIGIRNAGVFVETIESAVMSFPCACVRYS